MVLPKRAVAGGRGARPARGAGRAEPGADEGCRLPRAGQAGPGLAARRPQRARPARRRRQRQGRPAARRPGGGRLPGPTRTASRRRSRTSPSPADRGSRRRRPSRPPCREEAAASAPTAVPAAQARFFVLAVDDLHTAPGSIAAARQAMTRFLDEQASPDDYVALVTTSGTVGVHQDFTRDRRALQRAIERVQSRYTPVEPGGTPYLSEYQAELIDRSDVEALRLAVQEILQTEDYLGEIGAREKAYAQARRMVFEIMARSGRTLATLESVVRGLSALPGRKTVVLLSDGFLVGLGAAENRAFDVRQDRRRRHARGRRALRPRHARRRGRRARRAGLLPGARRPDRAGRALEPAGARPRGAAPEPQRAGRGHGRFPRARDERSRRGLLAHPARQRGVLPARLRADERRARRALPACRGARARAGPARACARAAATSPPTTASRRPRRARRGAASASSARRSRPRSRSRACRCG